MNPKSTFMPWLGGLLSEFVGGVAHGAFTGGIGTSAVGASDGTLTTQSMLIKATLIFALVSGLKDVGLYVNKNPLPNLFAQPVIAPVPGPVATPTVSDQPSTLAQPIATPKP